MGPAKRTKAVRKQAFYPIGDINKLTHYSKITYRNRNIEIAKESATVVTLGGIKGFRVSTFFVTA